jgi:phage terminase large subunit-like protein
MPNSPLPSLPCNPSLLLKQLQQEAIRRKNHRKLTDYQPYEKQRDFHAAGAHSRERLLCAGNQLGKTLAAGMEYAMHLTGRYPDWWQGKRFDRAVVGWAAGITGESTRDNPQRLLLGRPGEHGTGCIPKDCIIDITPSRGVSDAIDSVKVKSDHGGVSHLAFKSYEKGREKWQGETIDLLWLDEEPPEDIYTEGLTRTNAVLGPVFLTFTPLLGMSEVVKRFMLDKVPGTHVTQMTIYDVEHYTPEQRLAIISSYPEHEREARTKGIPQLGSGRVFPVHEELIKVDAFELPRHWACLGGLDFGWDHPSAAVKLAWDKDADVLYVAAAHRQRQQTPKLFADTVKPWGAHGADAGSRQWMPWAWPHDGLQHDKGSGEQLAKLYANEGLLMLPDRATFEDGGFGVEAGIMEMLDRMQTGRFRVFAHLADWFEEFRLYHRKDGLIVKKGDDLISASRYAVMMRRFAKVKKTQAQSSHRPLTSWMTA